LSGEELNAWDGFFVSDGDTDLGWGHALLGHGDDELRDTSWGVSDPSWASSLEWSDC